MANGETITRSIGFAILRVGDAVTTDEVVFGEAGDLQLLGARTLEGLNLRVDSRNRKLVAAGPLIAAGNVGIGRPWLTTPSYLETVMRSGLFSHRGRRYRPPTRGSF